MKCFSDKISLVFDKIELFSAFFYRIDVYNILYEHLNNNSRQSHATKNHLFRDVSL